MKKRKLEMQLEKIRGFESPDVRREQYATPAVVASELLYFAYMNGDLAGSVADLGCGKLRHYELLCVKTDTLFHVITEPQIAATHVDGAITYIIQQVAEHARHEDRQAHAISLFSLPNLRTCVLLRQ